MSTLPLNISKPYGDAHYVAARKIQLMYRLIKDRAPKHSGAIDLYIQLYATPDEVRKLREYAMSAGLEGESATFGAILTRAHYLLEQERANDNRA